MQSFTDSNFQHSHLVWLFMDILTMTNWENPGKILYQDFIFLMKLFCKWCISFSFISRQRLLFISYSNVCEIWSLFARWHRAIIKVRTPKYAVHTMLSRGQIMEWSASLRAKCSLYEFKPTLLFLEGANLFATYQWYIIKGESKFHCRQRQTVIFSVSVMLFLH